MENAKDTRSLKVLISEAEIARRVDELAAQIDAEYPADADLVVIGVLKGGVFFCCDLVKRLKTPVRLDFFQTSSYGSGKTDRLLIAPQDLRTADATRASEIYAGRFAFAGKVVICDRRSPFEMTPPSDEWAVMLLSFQWLRHLRAADSAITCGAILLIIDAFRPGVRQRQQPARPDERRPRQST